MTRLLSVGLETYGALEGRTLPLGAGLTIVAGANEAGKSTARNALADLLWGLPMRHPLAEVTPRPTIRISAELQDCDVVGGPDDGSVVPVTRTSRGLHGGDGLQPVRNPWGTDGDGPRTRWLTAFGLDHAALRDGGRQVCDGGGDLAELVFTAQHGRTAQSLLKELDQRADALFKDHRGSKNVRLRVALEGYRRDRRSLDEALVRASLVVEAEATVQDLRRRAAEAADQEVEALRRVTQVAQHTRCLDTVHAVHRVRRDILTVRDEGVVLEGDDLTTHDQARSTLQDADQEHARITEQVDRWTAERDALTVDHAVLADAPVVEDLRAQAEARLGDRDRAEARRREADNQDGEARRHLEAVVGHCDTRDTGSLLDAVTLPADLTAQLSASADQRPRLLADRERDAEQVERDRRRIDALAQGPALPDVEAVAPLATAVRALTADNSAPARLRAARDARVESRRRRRQAMIEAGAVDPEAAPPAPPAEEDTARAARRLADARERAGRLEQRLHDAQATLEEHRRQQREQEDPRTVRPDMLARARTERDAVWADITRAWVDGGAVTGTDPRTLASTFDHRLHAADDLADRLIDQARTDAELAQAQRNVDNWLREVRERELDLRAAAETVDAEAAAWQTRWAEAGVVAPPIVRVEAVRQALVAAAAAAVDEAAARETAEVLRPELVEWTLRLRGLLAALSPTPTATAATEHPASGDFSGAPSGDSSGDPFGEVLTDLEHLLEAARSLIADVDRAREHQERRRAAQGTLAGSRERLARSEQALAEWSAGWATLLSAAALPTTLDPTGWAERRTHLDAARTAHRSAVQLRSEADAALQAWDSFRAAVCELGARHGLAGSPDRVVADLADRLTMSRADERTHAERTAAIDDGSRRLAQLADQRASARSHLDELCRSTCLDGHEELARAADRGHRLARHREIELTLLEQLRAAVDHGHDPEEVLAALIATDRADLQVRSKHAEQEHAQTQQVLAELTQELGAARKVLADLEQRADAGGLNARVQEAVATVAELAEEYASLHLQRCLLRDALEVDASRRANPLLKVAGRILERLTGGRWVALQAEDDGAGTRRLNVVRRDGTCQSPAALSEGTADQVFLALRLAGILHLQNERRRAGQAPLPVVLDDVLMAFDDERARGALQTIAEVAAGMGEGDVPMQVVLFTHHDHLAHLAEQLGRDDVRLVRLSARSLPDERLDPEVLRESAARSGAALTAAARAPFASRQSPVASRRPPVASRQTPVSSSRVAAEAAGASPHQVDPSAVRSWARQNGIEVAGRGRLPAELIDRYLACRHSENGSAQPNPGPNPGPDAGPDAGPAASGPAGS